MQNLTTRSYFQQPTARAFTPTDLAEAPEPCTCPVCEDAMPCPDLMTALGDVQATLGAPINADVDLDADPSEYWLLPIGPHSAGEWGGPAPEGPAPIDAAWWDGFTAARDDAEQRIRDLEYTIDRLETMLGEARAELIGRGR